MYENKVTINELTVNMVDELRRIGYAEVTIYRNYYPQMRQVVAYYERLQCPFYSVKITNEMVELYHERYLRNEISYHYQNQMKHVASRMNEFYITDTLRIQANKHGTVYSISAEYENLIDRFITIYQPVQRKASNNTVNNYRIVLNQFIKYVSELKKVPYTSVTSAMIGKETVNGYLDSLLNEKNISSATRNNRLAALKSFLNYAAALKPEYISIMSEVSSIKAQRIPLFSKVDYMTEEAITALLNEPDTSTEIGVRDQFFMILLYDTGGRIQEIIDIRISDIKIGKTPSVLLHGKGNKDRVVPPMDNTVGTH